MEEDIEIDTTVIEEIKSDRKVVDIRERAFAFAVRIIKLCKFLEKNPTLAKMLSINYLMRELRLARISKKRKPDKAEPILFIKTRFR